MHIKRSAALLSTMTITILMATLNFSCTKKEPPNAPPTPAQELNKKIDTPQKPLANSELEKLNTLQKEIASLSDADIEKEIESIKLRAQKSGLLQGKKPEEVDINAHPEEKEMLLRMALLRIEKSKRDKKIAGGEEK